MTMDTDINNDEYVSAPVLMMIIHNNHHCVKDVHIQSYSGLHFSRISRIRTEYGEIWS